MSDTSAAFTLGFMASGVENARRALDELAKSLPEVSDSHWFEAIGWNLESAEAQYVKYRQELFADNEPPF